MNGNPNTKNPARKNGQAAAPATAQTSGQTTGQTATQTTAQTTAQTGPQTITPELRRWIVEQAQAGCHPDQVLAAMKTSGWQEDVAVAAMEQTLSEHLAAVQAAAASAGSAATAPASAPSLPPASAVPEPQWAGKTQLLMPDGHTVHLLSTLRHPRVMVLGGFLSEAECDALMALAQPRLTRSETVDNGTGGSEVNAARTSEGMFFERGEAAVIQRIEQRIAHLVNWPVDHGEGLQILRYRPGAEYRPHHDYFDPAHAGSKTILARGGQRVATLVMYLNTPASGGATTFPDAGLEVLPLRGNAVYFSYDRAHPCTGTLHGGAPVLAGEKWVATKWLRQGVFV